MGLAGVGFYNNNIPLSTLLTPAAFVALCFGSTTALKSSDSETLFFKLKVPALHFKRRPQRKHDSAGVCDPVALTIMINWDCDLW